MYQHWLTCGWFKPMPRTPACRVDLLRSKNHPDPPRPPSQKRMDQRNDLSDVGGPWRINPKPTAEQEASRTGNATMTLCAFVGSSEQWGRCCSRSTPVVRPARECEYPVCEAPTALVPALRSRSGLVQLGRS